ncbi:restriction endonuclease subunit S [Vibrio cholerae]
MGSDAKFVQLGSLCSQVLTGGTPLTKNKHFYDGGTIPWLKTKEVNFNFIESTENYITEAGLAGSSAKLVPVNSVIVAMYGQGDTAGRVAVNKIPVTTNQACCNLVIDPLKADYRFVYYYLKSSYSELVRRKTGSAQPNLNTKILKDFEIVDLPLARQTAIGDQLEALDQKIILNRQINQTLEQMAQTLFKSWFVDFDPVIDNALDAGNPIPDELQHRAEVRKAVRESEGFKPLPDEVRQLFPDAFEESELGWVPKGWKPSNVGAEFDVTMGQSPPGSTYNELGIGIPFFQGKTDFGFRYPTNRIFCSEPKRLAEKADTLISVRAPVGDINLAAENCAIGRGLAAARHKSGSPSFTYYAMSNLSTHFEVFEGEGTVFGCINQKDFKALPQIKVTTDVIAKFDEHCGVWDKKIETVSEQIGNLTKLRDTLLPKLISGELRLDEIELAVEQEAVSAEQQNER